MNKNANVILGLDNKKTQLKIIALEKGRHITTKLFCVPVDCKFFQDCDYFQIVNSALFNYFTSHSRDFMNVSFVLPSSCFAIDYITVPNVKNKTIEFLQSEITKLYKNYRDLEMISSLMSSDKNNQTFQIVSLQKSVINNIRKACNLNKLNLKEILVEGICKGNFVLSKFASLKKSNYMFVDVCSNMCEIDFFVGEKLFGFTEIDYGYNDLMAKDFINRILKQNEKAINYAMELASKKKFFEIKEIDEKIADVQDFNSLELVENFKSLKRKIAFYKASFEKQIEEKIEIIVINIPKNLSGLVSDLKKDLLDKVEIKIIDENGIVSENDCVQDNIGLCGATNDTNYSKTIKF